ncbi:trimeric intracellular cation channel family protein [Wohlfahrtiimonas larvae]|uniref:Trimeric intracellular cation channel family protein n=1 Tax=Wohlfahrtiimonas larvae TaxID=1157986 RepID=A0ABP9MSV4_9GAMM|nr:trimeric intracellular cation channel family protein [Wohlfahrtiimonas larvae]
MLFYIYIVAITAEAMSGALAAGRRNMDMFGVALIAFLTALGGGTMRDIILGNYPISWTQHPSYVYLTISAGLLTMLVARYMQRLNRMFLVLDAMGLIAFTIIGCNVALSLEPKYHYSTLVVVMAGMMTGVGGGIFRDILCNRTPQVLRHELYASVSLLVALLYLGLKYIGIDENINMSVSFVVGLSIRLAAIYWNWSLPVFSYSPNKWQ